MYLAALVTFVVLGIGVSRFQLELGLAEPSIGAREAVAVAVEVDRVMTADADYEEFSTALRVALVAHRTYAVRNTADGRVGHLLRSALDCYLIAREAWQAELEGAWDAETYGDPEYWSAAHPNVDFLGDAVLAAEDVIEACRAEAAEYVARTVEMVDR